MALIRSYKLTKYYGRVRGIEDLDLEVQEGEIFGFLGPNGAGKTTTIRILLNLIQPTRGRAEVFGLDVRSSSYEIRQRLGTVPGDVAFYEGMTGREFLDLVASFRRRERPRDRVLAERLELDLGRRIKTYSKGMKQKLAIIQALMQNPELLILDEPTLGLDPLMQREFYKVLQEERERGNTVFLSSHLLPEVERVCDRVGIIKEGRLVDVEQVSVLKRKKLRRMEIFLAQEIDVKVLEMEGVEVLHQEPRRVELAVYGNIPQLMKKVAGLPLEDMVFPESTLEDTFMRFYSEGGDGRP